ncbi:MAG: sigma-54 dependent transcriptional regulator [candidate division WOR-3 bacterium]
MPENRESGSAEDRRHELVGTSAAMDEVRKQIRQVAPTSVRVLVTGETGTGKELVAYWLHRLSSRRDRPYVKVNCAAIPQGLLESELFGHARGAFTGAVQDRQGRFELADGGTLLLDEIGDMDPLLQAKLLRVIETGEFEPLGSSRRVKVDVRIISATNRDLRAEAGKGRFREDLFHRLNVFTIHIPPLRERPEDIPILARHFLESYRMQCGLPLKRFSTEAEASLTRRSYPGNVRELRNIVERAAIVAQGEEIRVADLEAEAVSCDCLDMDAFSRTRPLARALEELERRYLQVQLELFSWDMARVASELQVDPGRLARRLKQLGLSRPADHGK